MSLRRVRLENRRKCDLSLSDSSLSWLVVDCDRVSILTGGQAALSDSAEFGEGCRAESGGADSAQRAELAGGGWEGRKAGIVLCACAS